MIRYAPRHRHRRADERAKGHVEARAEERRAGSDMALLWRVFGETAGYRWHIVGIALLGLLATPLALLSPVPLKIVVDSVLGSDPVPSVVAPLLPERLEASSHGLLVFAAALMVVVSVTSQVQSTTQTVLETFAGERITLRFRARLLANAQRLSFAFHDRRGTADSIYRIQRDAPAAQYIVIYGVLPLVSALVTLVSMILVVTRINLELALVALAISPFLFASAYFYKVRMRPLYREAKNLESVAGKVVQEILTSIRVVMAFGRETHEQERFTGQSLRGLRARVRLTAIEGGYGAVVALITALGTAAVLYMGARSVQAGEMSLGDLLVVMSYLSQLYGPLKTISRGLSSLQNHLASAERALELLDEVPEVIERPNARPIERAAGRLEFRRVTFAYTRDRAVLRDVSFAVPAGFRLGIVGRTGAGKTTLVSLLSRFYDPDAGEILLDGCDLRDYRLADLRNQFAVVLQEPVLFATSISENIAYARPDATATEIIEAARAAEADFIEKLPHGFDTVVGERGMSLSGGERQRISLARAFLKDAPILILDEPTSSVDSRTEASIMDAMERLMHGRTTIMIAHRLGTLAGCDALLEIEDGRASLRPTPGQAPVEGPLS